MSADVLSFAPALRLLIAAALDSPAMRAVAMTPADWRDLPALASRHGLAALLPGVVLHRPETPSHVRDGADRLSRNQALAALCGVGEAARISAALAKAGIASVALKGPAFSAWLYGELGFRRFSDLDILISPRHLTAAGAALSELGYALPPGMSTTTARVIYGDLGAFPMAREGSLPLDLHWRLAQRRFASPLTAGDVIEASAMLPLAQLALNVPSPTHAAVLTLLHGAKHLWCTLEILLSIARLLRRGDVDWLAARSLIERSHGWRGAAAGLMLASDIFEVALPRELAPRADGALHELRGTALEALMRPVGEFADRWIERRAHRAALDRWTDRVRYDAWRVLSPTPLEWAWCPLPDRLVALYTPLRVLRLGLAATRGGWPRAAGALTGTAAARSARDDAARPSTRAGRESPRTSA